MELFAKGEAKQHRGDYITACGWIEQGTRWFFFISQGL
jgi:hypothetical protein